MRGRRSRCQARSPAAGQLRRTSRTRNYELQENDTITQGAHTIKFGARLRETRLTAQSTSNYSTYTFQTPDNASSAPCLAGIANPTSLDVYQRIASSAGYSDVDDSRRGLRTFGVHAECGTGTVCLASQFDAGLFVQDDWRVRPGLTLSGGLRYEMQTNIGDKADLAPRMAISWAPGSTAATGGKTVLRAGWGIFYDRFPIGNTLNTLRYNGSGQQNYNITSTSGNLSQAYAALAYFATPGGPPLSLLATANPGDL